MTEITLEKKTFLATLEALRSRFELASQEFVLETLPEGNRYSLTGTRAGNIPVQAFGPCEVKGTPVSVRFDIAELESAIVEAVAEHEVASISLLSSEGGIWVKDPAPVDDED